MQTPEPAKGGAMPSSQTDEKILDTLRDMEIPIGDLTLMARITSDFLDRMFHQQVGERGGNLVFHISRSERDAALFAVNDLESRALQLKRQYAAGIFGEGA